jgi:hypothetical protein
VSPADETLELRDDRPLGGFRAEHETRDRDDDDEQRRDGEERVVRERRAHARRVVVDPRRHRVLDELPQAPHRFRC